MNLCLILNGYRDRALQIYKYKSNVSGNKGRKERCAPGSNIYISVVIQN